MPKKVYFTIPELRAQGFDVPKWLSLALEGSKRRGYDIRARPTDKGRGGANLEYHIDDVNRFMTDWEAAPNYSPARSFTEKGTTWVPGPLLDAGYEIDGRRRRFSKTTLRAWCDADGQGCPWLGGKKLVQLRKLAMCEDGLRRYVLYYREGQLAEIEQAMQTPPNADLFGLAEAQGRGFTKTDFEKLKPKKRLVLTRTARGKLTVQKRPVVSLPADRVALVEPSPVPAGLLTIEAAARKAGLNVPTSRQARAGGGTRIKTLMPPTMRRWTKGYRTLSGQRIKLVIEKVETTRNGQPCLANHVVEKTLDEILADRRARSAPDARGDYIRVKDVATEHEGKVTYAALMSRLEKRDFAEGWDTKLVPGSLRRREIGIHKRQVPILLSEKWPPDAALIEQAKNWTPAPNGTSTEGSAASSVNRTPSSSKLPPAWHNDDFTEVAWFGTRYTFTLGVQSRSVKVLWAAYETGETGLHVSTIAEKVGSEAARFKLDAAFRDSRGKPHPAWGGMIQRAGRGRARLAPPTLTPPPP